MKTATQLARLHGRPVSKKDQIADVTSSFDELADILQQIANTLNDPNLVLNLGMKGYWDDASGPGKGK